ncbi:hypothetical protein [Mycobacterium sp. UM_CSW]|uniref:hypothetical protein n=1 Tax=Mycobacterium sp. UM_CSW TaxID=1370119 RepID=UPI001EF9CF78|nr:hypothetical protein [Mycobacterium sp. UM_CSW]
MLKFDGQTYTFHYIREAAKVLDFRPFLGFPRLDGRYESDNLFPLFAQRAMAPRRPDFQRWVTRLGLTEDSTPWEQIARSEGRREGDQIQLFPVPVIRDGQMDCDFLVHGVRHVFEHEIQMEHAAVRVTRDELEQQLGNLRVGDRLALLDEPSNHINPRAILTTTTGGFPLGWVPDLLVDEVHRIPRDQTQVTLRAVNGPTAGWHLRLLAHLTARVPADFQVFQGDRWQSLAE